MKHHIVPPHAPTAHRAEGIRHQAAVPRNACLHIPEDRKRTCTALPEPILWLSWQHRHLNNRNQSPLSPRKVPDSNKNSPLKISDSKGQQLNKRSCREEILSVHLLGKPYSVCTTKAPSVTSSSRFKSTLASHFGHLSKPQVHPRAAKTTTKPRDIVSKWGETNSPFQACLLPGSWWPRLHFPKVGIQGALGFRLWGLQAFQARGQLRKCPQPRRSFSEGCGAQCLGKDPQHSGF